MAQFVQAAAWALEYVPAPHGSGVDEPVGQKLPGVQLRQAVLPASGVKEPAGQSSHIS